MRDYLYPLLPIGLTGGSVSGRSAEEPEPEPEPQETNPSAAVATAIILMNFIILDIFRELLSVISRERLLARRVV